MMLLHLPNGKTPPTCAMLSIATLGTLPTALRRSLTWDQGKEMARHREFTLATDIGRLLLRSAQSLAAWLEREHQRASAAVLSEEH